MTTFKQIKDYWEHCTPLRDEDWPYEKMRDFRYNQLQTYMLDTIRFERFKGMYVLEVGCGAGIDSLEFARHGAYVNATDITNDALRLTLKNTKQAGLPISITHLHESGHIPGESFYDVVYSFGVLHHIPDVHSTLDQIQKVLKTGGKFIGMLYNRSSILYEYSIKHLHEHEGLTEEQLTCKYSERNVGCPYTKAYTTKEVYKLFKLYFSSVDVQTRYNVIDLPGQRKVKLDLPEGHPQGWHLVVECTK